MPAETRITLTPDTPVRYLKGVGPKTAERFEKLGIVTLADLLCHYPRRYIDFTKPYSIAEAPTDVECVVRAEVFAKPGGRILPGGRRMERITAGDDVSSLEITWFNNPYAAQKLQLGQEYYFQGIVTGGMLRRPQVSYADLPPFDGSRPPLPAAVTEEVEIQVKYAGYLARQEKQVAEFRKEEARLLPPDMDYTSIQGLRLEARQKLQDIRPVSLGQAGRISGVSPADIAVLMIYLENN